MALAAVAIGLYGPGQFAEAFARGGGHSGGRHHQRHDSEAQLGDKHGEARQNDCTLIVPANPLTAQGLATPYQLTASANGGANCDEATPDQATFVQAAVLDPATGQISIYNPLVIDKGAQPATAPVVPTLPAGAVVGIFFGSNGTGLRLKGATFNTLASAKCVNGLAQSIFGQVAYCNAVAFFQSANQFIQAKKLVPPALGTGNDGMTCPSVRDFSAVDQDQSDNVTTTYRITQDGKLAQNTAATAAAFPDSDVLSNGSDNRLVAVALDNVLGCAPWKAPDLADPGQMVPALPLDELQAAMHQQSPIALVPSMDPMVVVDGQANLQKQNLYRAGVDQPNEATIAQAKADQKAYCQSLLDVAPARIQLDQQWTEPAASPDAGAASNLFTFLANRFDFTFGPDGLNCTGLLNVASPVKLAQNDNGVVTAATFTTPQQAQVSPEGATAAKVAGDLAQAGA